MEAQEPIWSTTMCDVLWAVIHFETSDNPLKEEDREILTGSLVPVSKQILSLYYMGGDTPTSRLFTCQLEASNASVNGGASFLYFKHKKLNIGYCVNQALANLRFGIFLTLKCSSVFEITKPSACFFLFLFNNISTNDYMLSM